MRLGVTFRTFPSNQQLIFADHTVLLAPDRPFSEGYSPLCYIYVLWFVFVCLTVGKMLVHVRKLKYGGKKQLFPIGQHVIYLSGCMSLLSG